MTLPGYAAVVDIANGVNPLGKAQLLGQGLREVMETINPPTTDYYVDEANGSDSNDGLTWRDPLDSIQATMTLAAALGTRGRWRCFVAPGGYSEDILTPLNSESPFGQLIAWNPTGGRSAGAVWLQSATSTLPALTVRARGMLISGFEFDANSGSGGGGLLLDTVTSNANAKFANIVNCLFIGTSQVGAYGILTNEPNPLVVISNCYFAGFAGKCIDATDYPLQWTIQDCDFENSAKYIAPSSSKGFQQAIIRRCNFNHISGDYTAAIKIDMRGGAQNHIGPDNFMGFTYDHAGGYYASSTDYWKGNHTQDGLTYANPAA